MWTRSTCCRLDTRSRHRRCRCTSCRSAPAPRRTCPVGTQSEHKTHTNVNTENASQMLRGPGYYVPALQICSMILPGTVRELSYGRSTRRRTSSGPQARMPVPRHRSGSTPPADDPYAAPHTRARRWTSPQRHRNTPHYSCPSSAMTTVGWSNQRPLRHTVASHHRCSSYQRDTPQSGSPSAATVRQSTRRAERPAHALIPWGSTPPARHTRFRWPRLRHCHRRSQPHTAHCTFHPFASRHCRSARQGTGAARPARSSTQARMAAGRCVAQALLSVAQSSDRPPQPLAGACLQDSTPRRHHTTPVCH